MTRLEELLVRWRDDALTPGEADELLGLLQTPEGRRALVEEFCYAEAVASALREKTLQQAPSPLAGAPVATGRGGGAARRTWRRSWPIRVGLAAAAVVLVVLATWLLPRPGGPVSPTESHQVLSGQVLVEGAVARKVADGTAVRVAEDQPAVIQLTDGSRAELEPASQAVLHGPAYGFRQMVELVEGGGTFQVEKGAGQFQVETRLGRVTALGTEFRVAILEGQRLAVGVRSGLVEVDLGGRTALLSAGESRVFAGDRRARQSRGFLVAVDPQKITVTKGRTPAESTLAVGGEVQVFIDGRPARLADLPKGSLVYLQQPDEKAPVSVIRAEGMSAGGDVRAVDPARRTITLVGRPAGRGQQADPSYAIDPDAPVTIGGKPAQLADVQPGSKVMLKMSVDRQRVIGITIGGGPVTREPRERK
jgi:ferric-dicitrate binding protein FerR (iron transport regulator)